MICTRFRWLAAAIASGSCLAAISADVLAQAYPTRPIRLIIPYSAGGPTDIMGRTMAQKLGEILKEPFVAENRASAAGIVGTAAVAKAAPDGYTLLFSDTAPLTLNPNFYKSLPYNSRTEFTPLGSVASGAVFLFVNTTLPVRTIRELIALAKSKPGELSYGSAGIGQFPTHIGPELFRVKNGLDVINVPYKGSGQAIVDVAAGRVSFMMTTGFAAAQPFLDSGKVRALALTGDKRAAALPDVPTFVEAGSPLPEMNTGSWWGIWGPAGLPRSMAVRLNESIVQALAAPDVLARLATLNMDPMPRSLEAFAGLINADIETWSQVLKPWNITPQ